MMTRGWRLRRLMQPNTRWTTHQKSQLCVPQFGAWRRRSIQLTASSTPPPPAAASERQRRLEITAPERSREKARQQCHNTGVFVSNFRSLFRRPLAWLSDLRVAVGELALIAALSSIGTVIEQDKPTEFYVQNYPSEGPKVLGFLTHNVIKALQLDHIFTSTQFLALAALLAVSLVACTSRNQIPAAKRAHRWEFLREASSFSRLPVSAAVPDAAIADFGALLSSNGYQCFLKDGALYAFKGLAGKLGPIGVHASMVAIIAGVTAGALLGATGKVMIPEGTEVQLSEVLKPHDTFLAGASLGGPLASMALRLENFEIQHRADGSVQQFESTAAVVGADGIPRARQRMRVNAPFRYGGVTAYQVTWGLSSLEVRCHPVNGADGERTLTLPLATLKNKSYATFLPLEPRTAAAEADKMPRGITLIAEDPQLVALYDSSGSFAGVQRPGSGRSTVVEGLTVQVARVRAASGFELKTDPGVPLVYAGFGGMCVTTVLSYLSHSQVWAVQEGRTVVLGGRSNRGKLEFEQELKRLADSVPEVEVPC